MIVPGPGARPDTAPPTMFDRPAWEARSERPPVPPTPVQPPPGARSPVPPSSVRPGARPEEGAGATGGDRTVIVPPPQPGSPHAGSLHAEGAGVHEQARPGLPDRPGRPGGTDEQDALATQALDRRAPGGVPAPPDRPGEPHGPGEEDPFDQDRTRADFGRQDFAPGQVPPPADPWQAPHRAEHSPYAEPPARPQSFEPQSFESRSAEQQPFEQQPYGPRPGDPQQQYGPPPRAGDQVRYPGYGAVSATPPGAERRAGRRPMLWLGTVVVVLAVVVAIAFVL